MFLAALFTIVRKWDQPKCPSTDGRIKKMWCVYAMEFYSTVKNEIMTLQKYGWNQILSKIHRLRKKEKIL